MEPMNFHNPGIGLLGQRVERVSQFRVLPLLMAVRLRGAKVAKWGLLRVLAGHTSVRGHELHNQEVPRGD